MAVEVAVLEKPVLLSPRILEIRLFVMVPSRSGDFLKTVYIGGAVLDDISLDIDTA
jgi:hypothetical protein